MSNDSLSPVDRLQRPLRELRVSVTDRCNFRCTYCMPEDVYGESYRFAPRSEILSFEEIARIVGVAVERLGVRKLRLTGGEPLLRRELPQLVALLAAQPGLEDLTLTTNGSLLASQARALRDAGLQRITVSLDALDTPTFLRLSGGRGSVASVLAGIEAARDAGLLPLKINCVVQRGVNEHAVEQLAAHFRGTGAIVRFIEFMDVGTVNRWSPADVVSADEIRARIERVAPLEPLPGAHAGEVAERYRYRDGGGEVGIIASVTRAFCADCNRARLSADGRLLTCLFAEHGTDLRGPLRTGASDHQLARSIAETWRAREDRYSELRAERLSASQPAPHPKRRLQMFQVGG
jgi:cyclic pyranopterin phosphate synthase